MGTLLRFLAGVFLLVAVIFAVNDATRLAGPDRASAVSVHQTWSAVSPNSLNAAQRGIQSATHSTVWNWGVLPLLQLPAWTLFGLLGLILAFLGRRRRRVNIYAN